MTCETPKPNLFTKAATITAFSELGIRRDISNHPAWRDAWAAATAEYEAAKQRGVTHPELNELCLEAAKDAIRQVVQELA